MASVYKVWTGTQWTTPGGGSTPAEAWTRPSDWLSMTSAPSEGFLGLFAVSNNDQNKVALKASGNYTVDWGDGTIENFSAGTKAEHEYTYASIPSNTASTRGYRQVLIKVTPQTPGGFTSLSLYELHTDWESLLTTYYIPNIAWLDIKVQGSNLANLKFSYDWVTDYYVPLTWLERIVIGNNSLTSMVDLFRSNSSWAALSKLYVIEIGSSPSLTSLERTCYENQNLKKFTISDAPVVTTSLDMFNGCSSLAEVTITNTPLLYSAESMFEYCYNLTNVTFTNLDSLYNSDYMFYQCYRLENITLPALPDLYRADYMFFECNSLKQITIPPLPSLYRAQYMFKNCYSLESVSLNISTNFQLANEIFYGCLSVDTISVQNAGDTDFTYAFGRCFKLENFTLTFADNSSCSFSYAFNESYGIKEIVLTNNCSQLNATDFANYCNSLEKIRLPNLSNNLSVSGTKLSRTAIVDLFNDLATVGVYRTISISNTPGTADLTPSDLLIATNKGWTVLI